jgi:hypothetical protein
MGHTRDGQPYAGGSETSYEAALRAKAFVSEQGLRVFQWLKGKGSRGGTQREAERELHISRPSLCARFKALTDAGAIRATVAKREHCAVYVTTGGTVPQQLGMF